MSSVDDTVGMGWGSWFMTGNLACIVSQVRRDQPRDAVAQLHGQRAAVHFLQSHEAGGGAFGFHDGLELFAKVAAVALDIKLKIQPQA